MVGTIILSFLGNIVPMTDILMVHWIAILKIKRNKEIVFHYENGKITDRMDDFDKIIYQEIVDTYNKL